MRIETIEKAPFYTMAYLNVDGRGERVRDTLPFFRGRAHGIPAGVDAVVCTSDLQGRVPGDSGAELLGVNLARELLTMHEAGLLPAPERLGVFLCGDLYAREGLDKRGGSGDVTGVWEAFADQCAWVAGVAGNHCGFGPYNAGLEKLSALESVHYLDADFVYIGDTLIAGLSGIIGNPRRSFRRDLTDYIGLLKTLVSLEPQVLLLHESPQGNDPYQHGNSAITDVLSATAPLLCLSGHSCWVPFFEETAAGLQVINLEKRVVVLDRR